MKKTIIINNNLYAFCNAVTEIYKDQLTENDKNSIRDAIYSMIEKQSIDESKFITNDNSLIHIKFVDRHIVGNNVLYTISFSKGSLYIKIDDIILEKIINEPYRVCVIDRYGRNINYKNVIRDVSNTTLGMYIDLIVKYINEYGLDSELPKIESDVGYSYTAEYHDLFGKLRIYANGKEIYNFDILTKEEN